MDLMIGAGFAATGLGGGLTMMTGGLGTGGAPLIVGSGSRVSKRKPVKTPCVAVAFTVTSCLGCACTACLNGGGGFTAIPAGGPLCFGAGGGCGTFGATDGP